MAIALQRSEIENPKDIFVRQHITVEEVKVEKCRKKITVFGLEKPVRKSRFGGQICSASVWWGLQKTLGKAIYSLVQITPTRRIGTTNLPWAEIQTNGDT